jgi:predicted RNase H-like HicB family nuclease
MLELMRMYVAAGNTVDEALRLAREAMKDR